MRNFLKYRTIWTFSAIVFGTSLIINLMVLATEITGSFSIYPYTVFMLVALGTGIIGFVKVSPELLGYSSVAWLISIAFNFAAVFFVIPIFILNYIGRSKTLNRLENNKEERDGKDSTIL